jgi:hypothetical protein
MGSDAVMEAGLLDFSFGLCTRSSSRPEPMSRESTPRIRRSEVTTGIDPPPSPEPSTSRRKWRPGCTGGGKTSHIWRSDLTNEALAWSAIGANPMAMRVDPLGVKREDNVPAHKALPVQLSSDHERELNNLVRAHSTPQKLAERARIILLAAAGQGELARDARDRRDGAATGDLAPDGRPLAAPVAGRGCRDRGGGTFERRAPLRYAGDVRTRGDLPNHGHGL